MSAVDEKPILRGLTPPVANPSASAAPPTPVAIVTLSSAQMAQPTRAPGLAGTPAEPEAPRTALPWQGHPPAAGAAKAEPPQNLVNPAVPARAATLGLPKAAPDPEAFALNSTVFGSPRRRISLSALQLVAIALAAGLAGGLVATMLFRKPASAPPAPPAVVLVPPPAPLEPREPTPAPPNPPAAPPERAAVPVATSVAAPKPPAKPVAKPVVHKKKPAKKPVAARAKPQR